MRALHRQGRVYVLVAATMLPGCVDQDPFGFTRRRVVGPYTLEQFEGGTLYLLHGPGAPPAPGGRATDLLDGSVVRIGWDTAHIVVERQAHTGLGIDFMVVDVARRAVRGPYPAAAITADPALRRLPLAAADSAWAGL